MKREGVRRSVASGQLTGRDLGILRWLGRVRFAAAAQVEQRFALCQSQSYRRLRALAGRGLVDRTTLWHQQPGVFHVTRAGLRVVGREGFSPPVVSQQTYHHDLVVVSVQIELELEGVTLLTEREMYRLERHEGRSFAVEVPADARRDMATHRPDLVLVGPDREHAIEVELTAKSQARLESILAAYLTSDRYGHVLYMVPDQRSHDRIWRIARGIGMGADRLQVSMLDSLGAAA